MAEVLTSIFLGLPPTPLVALAALKGNKTISQLCNEYQLAASVIQPWKTLVQILGPNLFNEKANNINSFSAAHEAEKAKLY